MNASVEKLPKSRVRLRIEIPPDEVRPFLERAARDLSNEQTPKGFRPGSAPFEVMRNTVGDEKIAERALKALVPKTYVAVLLEREEIEAIGPPEVKVGTIAFDAPWTYHATVAVLPEVKLGQYRGLKGERRAVTVEASEVEREIEAIRKMRASYLTVPRPAKLGDRVEVDVAGRVDKVLLPMGEQKRQPLLLGEGHVIPGFEEHLCGMNEGETKTFSVMFPSNHHRSDLQGRNVEFQVTMHTVQQRILPALDDAFAKGLGNFQNLQDLNEKLAQNIREEKERHERERLQQEFLDQVVAAARYGEFPELLVERELDTMLAELQEGVSAMGLAFDAYLAQVRKTKDELRAGMTGQALRRIRAGLALRAVAKAENLAATADEVEAEVNEVLKRFPNPAEAEKRLDLDVLRDVAEGSVRNRKVFALLEDIAVKNGGR